MSYILDALKKSDQQRQRGTAPTLLTPQLTVPGPRQARLMLNGAAVAVLLCTGIAVGWLRPWQPDRAASVRETAGARLTTPPARLVAQVAAPRLPEVAGARDRPALASAGAALSSDAPRLAGDAPRPALPRPAAAAPLDEAPAVPERSNAAVAADAGQGKKVLALGELPASIQQELPAISISFHVYSRNPKERRVMINGAMVAQGEAVAPGLSLDEITPDGVILAYNGYHFRRGVR